MKEFLAGPVRETLLIGVGALFGSALAIGVLMLAGWWRV